MNEYKKFRKKFKPEKRCSKCCLCGSADLFYYTPAHLRYYIGNIVYYEDDPDVWLVICEKCGLLFETPLLPIEYYDETYRNFYIPDTFIDVSSIERDQKLKYQSRIEMISNAIESYSSPKILEIGCWFGTFLNELSKQYPNATLKGIEASRAAFECCQKLYPELRDHTFNSTLESFDVGEKKNGCYYFRACD